MAGPPSRSPRNSDGVASFRLGQAPAGRVPNSGHGSSASRPRLRMMDSGDERASPGRRPNPTPRPGSRRPPFLRRPRGDHHGAIRPSPIRTRSTWSNRFLESPRPAPVRASIEDNASKSRPAAHHMPRSRDGSRNVHEECSPPARRLRGGLAGLSFACYEARTAALPQFADESGSAAGGSPHRPLLKTGSTKTMTGSSRD